MPDQPTTATSPGVDEMSASELLAAARQRRRVADCAEAELLVIAAQWADLHPPESIHDAASFSRHEHEEPIAGQGCPTVAEFCVPELGTVLGVSTMSAKRLIGHALELRHRLPRLWTRVQAGDCPAWRARTVAEATIHAHPRLDPEAVAWIDTQVAPFAARIGPAQLDRLVDEAIRRQHPVLPDDPDDPDPPSPDQRRVDIDTDQISYHGTAHLSGELLLADGIDLDHTLSHRAAVLKALGSTESLDARRAAALGEIARHQLALDLAGATTRHHTGPDNTGAGAGSGPGPEHTPVTLPAARRIVLHLHFAAGVLGDDADPTRPGVRIDHLGRLDERLRLVLLDQVKAWCRDSHTQVTVRPVIDLAAELTTERYEPTAPQRLQVQLRDRTCVFPWCTRPAARCDIDHTVPYDHDADSCVGVGPDTEAGGRWQPGPTTTSNLGCLCRFHHRLKTRGRWRVEQVRSGTFVWTSPHGHRYRRDPTGTTPLDEPPGPAADPPDSSGRPSGRPSDRSPRR